MRIFFQEVQESCWPQWEGVVCVPSSRVGHQVFVVLGILYLAIKYFLYCTWYLVIRYLLFWIFIIHYLAFSIWSSGISYFLVFVKCTIRGKRKSNFTTKPGLSFWARPNLRLCSPPQANFRLCQKFALANLL